MGKETTLNLRYLDASFMRIPTQTVHRYHKLPKLSTNASLPAENWAEILDRIESQNSKQKIDMQSTVDQSNASSFIQQKKSINRCIARTQEEQKIAKYKRMIEGIKKKNIAIHQQIVDIYKNKRLINKTEESKKVLCVEPLNRAIVFAQKPCTNKYEHIYEQLSSLNNSYKDQSEEIRKKLSSNNMQRNLQQFFIGHNRKLPQFLKIIR